uniref:Cytochrome c oxidase subunit 7B, mitochondrial n=1 Tax=Sphenodon punctatus TaxID=8508 RepID=A0A8D0H204_SPHPU
MFPLVRRALGLTARGMQRIAVRGAHCKYKPDFHDKSCFLWWNSIFCVVIWAYVATQIGLDWNMSPVGRVNPKEWETSLLPRDHPGLGPL